MWCAEEHRLGCAKPKPTSYCARFSSDRVPIIKHSVQTILSEHRSRGAWVVGAVCPVENASNPCSVKEPSFVSKALCRGYWFAANHFLGFGPFPKGQTRAGECNK
jgi:hypothetical protein